MLVQLTRRDVEECVSRGLFRTASSRAFGAGGQKRDESRDNRQLDIMGCFGEMAVCKLFGLELADKPIGMDVGADLWLGHEVSVDVKTTMKPYGNLTFVKEKSIRSDFAVLVCPTGDPMVMDVVGCTDAAHWEANKRHAEFADKCDYIPRDMLFPVEVMWRRWSEVRFSPKKMGPALPDPSELFF